jgi:hypothetical protein
MGKECTENAENKEEELSGPPEGGTPNGFSLAVPRCAGSTQVRHFFVDDERLAPRLARKVPQNGQRLHHSASTEEAAKRQRKPRFFRGADPACGRVTVAKQWVFDPMYNISCSPVERSVCNE